MVDKEDINKNLLDLGLSDEEARCYISLLNHNEMAIMELSKSVNIPRTTVYRICESLVEKKFAEWVVSDRGKNIKALTPDKLDFLVSEKKTELEHTEKSLIQLQAMIKDIAVNVPKTQVRYYQGAEGIKQMIWNTLKAEDTISGYSEFGRIEITGRSFYDKFVAEFKLRRIKDSAISNQRCLDYYVKHVVGEDSKHQIDADSVRIIPENIFYVSGDHSLYNDIYAITYWKGKEIVGVEIENAELVKLHKSIFEILWKIAEPVEKYL